MFDFPRPRVLRACALLAVVIAGLSFGGGYSLRDLMAKAEREAAARSALAAVQQARLTERREAEASAALGLQAARDQARTRLFTADLIRSIPAHVTPDADRNCTVPAGFVRLFDDAARGLSRPADPAGQPDDAAAGIALSAVAAGTAENFGLCHEIRGQLMALQQWEREVGRSSASARPFLSSTARE